MYHPLSSCACPGIGVNVLRSTFGQDQNATWSKVSQICSFCPLCPFEKVEINILYPTYGHAKIPQPRGCARSKKGKILGLVQTYDNSVFVGEVDFDIEYSIQT